MRRLDRARAIRDDLLARAGQWTTTRVGDKEVASFEWRGVNAVLWSCKDFGQAVDYAGMPEILDLNRSQIPPYTLDVWVRGLRVLSIAWNARDEIKLIRMVRGEWEYTVFCLPVRTGRSRPTVH